MTESISAIYCFAIMSGIAGIFSLDADKRINTRLLEEMTEMIRHRGPDDGGYLCVSENSARHFAAKDSPEELSALLPQLEHGLRAQLGLGFRRLATLDLSVGGHQPMSCQERGMHIVCDGEIYNYIELREELSSQGYKFYSNSDTEVILAAYEAWGQDCVKRFNGVWAFALWDEARKLLFCSRDRFGLKPFYYCEHGGQLFIASEVKQLLASGVDKELNWQMIWRSMKVNSFQVYGSETFWRQIHALPGGSNLIAKDGQVRLERYHRLDAISFGSSRLSLDEAVQRYQELFERAVRWQLRSDAEVGACLSGGLDSSAIVCTAARNGAKPIKTFSSWFAEPAGLDERQWIREVTEASGAVSHFVSPSAEEAAGWFDEVTWFNDLPAGAGFAAQYAVMKLAGESGVKVLLDGQGSDELTGGYRHAQYRHLADLAGRKGFWPEAAAIISKVGWKAKPAVMAKTLLARVLPESSLYKLEARHLRFEPFADELIQREKLRSDPLEEIEDIPGRKLSNFLYNMVYTSSLPTLLHWADRMSMASSVASRVPFLDHELVEFAFSLPSEYKIWEGQGKRVHRLAMRGIVPQAIYERKDKSIFGSPFHRVWLRGALKPWVEDIIYSYRFRERKIWNLPRIEARWSRYLKGDDQQAEMIFNICALEQWFRCWT